MNKIDKFKNFVKKNPELIINVKNEKMTWQKYYELYEMYGEDENIWKSYILKDNDNSNDNKKRNSSSKFNELLDIAKNIDVDKMQNGITSLQKAIGLFGDLFVNKKNEVNNNNSYTPRPIYRKFDD